MVEGLGYTCVESLAVLMLPSGNLPETLKRKMTVSPSSILRIFGDHNIAI